MNRENTIQIAFLLLRVVTGLLFFQAGCVKTFAWFGGMPGQPGETVELMSQIGIGAWMEVFGGILIVLGLGTRVTAFILSGEMAVAYWQFHAPNGTWPVINHGVPAVLFCFIFLFMAAYGGGDWSLDRLIKNRRNKSLPSQT
ncbi:MAG: DoxX family protein [bacterium]|nr:DoxX family protein [bacterium]